MENKQEICEKSKYAQRVKIIEKSFESNGYLEISEATGKLLDEDSNKILGSLYKNNQDRINNV